MKAPLQNKNAAPVLIADAAFVVTSLPSEFM
jgi:hypothetical protein